MEYQHDIHGLDVLLCGEDGLSEQQGMNNHATQGSGISTKNMDETVILIPQAT